MGHACVPAGVTGGAGCSRPSTGGTLGSVFTVAKVPPVSTAGTAGCPECQELPGVGGGEAEAEKGWADESRPGHADES